MSYSLSDLAYPVPRDLLVMLQEKTLLFLGFSPNDADVRAVVQRLYPKQKIKSKSLLIHRGIAGKLDAEIWKSYCAMTLELARSSKSTSPWMK